MNSLKVHFRRGTRPAAKWENPHLDFYRKVRLGKSAKPRGIEHGKGHVAPTVEYAPVRPQPRHLQCMSKLLRLEGDALHRKIAPEPPSPNQGTTLPIARLFREQRRTIAGPSY